VDNCSIYSVGVKKRDKS